MTANSSPPSRAATSLSSSRQPRRRSATPFRQLVADGMAERVVDALELVDVDIEHRELFARPDRLQRLFELLAKQDPVRQVGQRVVMRQMGDLLVGAGARGDVLDRGHPAARLQRPVDDLDRAAARRFRELARRLAERDVADDGRRRTRRRRRRRIRSPCGARSAAACVQPCLATSGDSPNISI